MILIPSNLLSQIETISDFNPNSTIWNLKVIDWCRKRYNAETTTWNLNQCNGVAWLEDSAEHDLIELLPLKFSGEGEGTYYQCQR